MRRSIAFVLLATTAASTAIAIVGSINARHDTGAPHALRAERVVVFMTPGVTWRDISEARAPTFDRLVREGATAALAPRTASVRPSSTRGYISLGAGNRAAAPNESGVAQRAYASDELVAADVDAKTLYEAENGRSTKARIVHLGVPELQLRQDALYHGARVGALGEALARAGIERGVVSAADRSSRGVPPDTGRGEAVLPIVDESGAVPHGVIRGLVEAGSPTPFGVRTKRQAFHAAVAKTLASVRVLLIEPGETARADDFSEQASRGAAARHVRGGVERTDALLAGVVERLDPRDLLIVLGPASSSIDPQEHLTPVIAWGAGVRPGELVSATTHSPGTVTLTDVAPTILSALGVDEPSSMSGGPMRQVDSDADRPRVHDDLDGRSVFREGFVPGVFYPFVALFVVLLVLVALVFLFHLPFEAPLAGVCYLILAVPLATFVLSAVPLWKMSAIPAHITLWSVSIVIAGAGWLVPGPRWTGALPMLLGTAVFVAVVLVFGGQLLSNAVFGNSVLAAGRFYGIPNTGSALFFGAGVLALAGIGELTPLVRNRVAIAAVLGALLVLTGLPGFGADVGGLLTGIAAAAIIILAMREGHVPWRTLVLVAIAAGGLTLLVGYLDSLRSPDAQTHLGRFATDLLAGDGTAGITIRRKASQALTSLSFSRFTYVIPLGLAALGVLMRRPRGPLWDVMATHRLFRAAMAGLLVAGILGFALNDSGVAVPALLLGQAVPLIVLLGVDHSRTAARLL